jgi:DNA-binding transcriptional ArsR family regulator
MAFELVAQLAAFTSGPARAALDAGKPWVREVRRLAGRDLLRRVERYDLGIYAQLATVALESDPPRDAAALVHALGGMEPRALQLRLLGADSQLNQTMVSDGAFERAVAGEPGARRELLTELAGNGAGRNAMRRVLDASPVELRNMIAGIVREWATSVLPAFADAAWSVIERDAEGTSAAIASRSPAAVISLVTNGVTYEPPRWITSMVVVPTVALRPFVIPVELRGTAIFVYSVSDDALGTDASAPPRRLVKVAAALGDELRLRILRAIGDEELSATEVAERLGVDRTTIHHHLGILRSAGLLAIRDEGERGWRYARRPDALALTEELETYVADRRRSPSTIASGARRRRGGPPPT